MLVNADDNVKRGEEEQVTHETWIMPLSDSMLNRIMGTLEDSAVSLTVAAVSALSLAALF